MFPKSRGANAPLAPPPDAHVCIHVWLCVCVYAFVCMYVCMHWSVYVSELLTLLEKHSKITLSFYPADARQYRQCRPIVLFWSFSSRLVMALKRRYTNKFSQWMIDVVIESALHFSPSECLCLSHLRSSVRLPLCLRNRRLQTERLLSGMFGTTEEVRPLLLCRCHHAAEFIT